MSRHFLHSLVDDWVAVASFDLNMNSLILSRRGGASSRRGGAKKGGDNIARRNNLHWERSSQNEIPKTMKMGLNGVQVALVGAQLGQNDTPDPKIMFQTFLDPPKLL